MASRLFETARTAPASFWAPTRDGWSVALYRYAAAEGEHATPVLLCHGMGSNRFNLDGPGRTSLARFLHERGYDVWLIELRGAGRTRRRLRLPPVRYRVSFEDYAQHDVPAALRVMRSEIGERRVLYVGHSLGGMVAYAVLMSPAGAALAGAVTLASPGMTDVGHASLDRFNAYRAGLRLAPARIPTGALAWLGAPLEPVLAAAIAPVLHDWGWRRENLDHRVVRFMMRRGVSDLPRSLLPQFARWYEAKHMSDRYGLFDFPDHLERIEAPVLLVAGSRDRLTPAADIHRVYERIGSEDKSFLLAGREAGLAHDYSHVDLVLSPHAADEIFVRIADWLDARRDLTRPG